MPMRVCAAGPKGTSFFSIFIHQPTYAQMMNYSQLCTLCLHVTGLHDPVAFAVEVQKKRGLGDPCQVVGVSLNIKAQVFQGGPAPDGSRLNVVSK